MTQRSVATMCLAILTIIIVFGVLAQARNVFAPIISALLLGVIMTPVSDLWDKARIPAALSAFLTVAIALSLILILMVLIEPYVSDVINQAPVILDELRGSVEELKRILRGFERISEDMAAAIDPTAPNGAAMDGTNGAVALPSITDALFYAPQFAAQFMIFTGTLYFFLMAKNDIYGWVSKTFNRFGEDELRLAGKQVARYVLPISAINLCLGVAVAIAMQVLGMPSPVLWGLLAFTLNFVFYLGPIGLIAMLTITGIVVFDGAASFLPAAVYLGMNATEAQFVTPALVGKSLSVNPLMVFLSLVFWLWLWGPIGGIIAIPLLIWGLTVFKGIVQSPVHVEA